MHRGGAGQINKQGNDIARNARPEQPFGSKEEGALCGEAKHGSIWRS